MYELLKCFNDKTGLNWKVLASLIGLGAGPVGGGTLGHYISNKENTKPAILLGTLGGAAGSVAGSYPGVIAHLIHNGHIVDNTAKKTTRLAKLIARHPRLNTAAGLGALTATMLAGGTLGATLGSKVGDAIA